VTHTRAWSSLLGSTAALLVLWSAQAGAAKAPPAPPCDRLADFVPANFPATPNVDNKYFPLTPGLQITNTGTSDVNGKPLAHRTVFTVTDLTKVIDGVRAHVIYDVDYDQDQIAEAELTFFAQDAAGNVWNLGEYPEEYQKGQPNGAPDTWIAGINGAEAGLQMPASPHLGEPYYIQGYSPTIDFLDCAQTFQENVAGVCVPFGCYDNVLVTDEKSPLDSGNAHQRKYYAPGVGVVKVGAVNDPEAENLALTNRAILDPDALAAVRQAALAAEARGLQSNKIYTQTTPSEQLPAPAPAPAAAPAAPPAAPAAAPGPPTAKAARAGLALEPVTRHVTRTGHVAVSLRCLASAACRGTLEILARGRRIGTTRFTVPSGREQILYPLLSARARRALRAQRRLPIVLRTRGGAAGGQPLAATTRVTLRAK
jgi:hypothetical protein